jgi:predicted metal-dependent hydrolase
MLRVKVRKFFIQHMKTKWGACNPERGTIRLNSELAKKPPECLEYLVVHEMVHLLEPTHNERFIALMDRFMPNWRNRKNLLNSLPVRHETWGY